MSDGSFVRNVHFEADSMSSVLFSDQQFYDLIRFCSLSTSILNIDTTFNLGDFYVTIMTYRHLGLYNPITKQNPTFFGPIMIHTKKDNDNFTNFAHAIEKHYLINKTNYPGSIHSVKKVITDDDSGLRNAFKLVFHKADFMLCANHLRKDISTEMGHFDMTKIQKEQVIFDIFGEQGNRSEALISCKSVEEYREKLEKLLVDWYEFKSNKNEKNTFKDYFLKNKYDKILDAVIKPNMRNYNPDQIDQYFSTNDVESKNHGVKSDKDKRVMKYSVSKMSQSFRDMVQGQENQAILALRGSGDYELSAEFKKYSISPMTWSSLTAEQQESKIKQFNRAFKDTCAEQIDLTKYYKQKKLEKDIKKELDKLGLNPKI